MDAQAVDHKEAWGQVQSLIEHPGWGVLLVEAEQQGAILIQMLRKKAGEPEARNIAGKLEGIEFVLNVIPGIIKSRASARAKEEG